MLNIHLLAIESGLTPFTIHRDPGPNSIGYAASKDALRALVANVIEQAAQEYERAEQSLTVTYVSDTPRQLNPPEIAAAIRALKPEE